MASNELGGPGDTGGASESNTLVQEHIASLEAFRRAYDEFLNGKPGDLAELRRKVIKAIPPAERALEAAGCNPAVGSPMGGPVYNGLSNTAFLFELPGFRDLRYLTNSPEIYEQILDYVDLAEARLADTSNQAMTTDPSGSESAQGTAQQTSDSNANGCRTESQNVERRERHGVGWQRLNRLPNWLAIGANIASIALFLAAVVGAAYVTFIQPREACEVTMSMPNDPRYLVGVKSDGIGCEDARDAVTVFEQDPLAFIHGQPGAPYNTPSKTFVIPPSSYTGISDLTCRYVPQGLAGAEHTVSCRDSSGNTLVWRTREA